MGDEQKAVPEVADAFYTPSLDYLFEPDPVLPAQFHVGPSYAEPERRLRLAILDDVYQMFLWMAAGKRYTRTYSRQGFREAQVWVASDDTEWPYSFVNLCDALGVEATRTRQQLLGLLAESKQAAYQHRHRNLVAPRMPITPTGCSA